jgi:hypothetical protein
MKCLRKCLAVRTAFPRRETMVNPSYRFLHFERDNADESSNGDEEGHRKNATALREGDG